MKRQTRFVSRHPARTIIATIEAVAESMGLKVHSQNYKVKFLVAFFDSSSNFAVMPYSRIYMIFFQDMFLITNMLQENKDIIKGEIPICT